MWIFGSSKTTIKESGLLNGFTDYHCHLLPGVDDGVKKMEETLEILSLWEEQGVSTVWLTPHIMEDVPNEPSDLKSRFDRLKQVYKGSIRLFLSAENMMDNLCSQRLAEDNLLPIGEEKRHLLVETSYFNPPYDMDDILGTVMRKGYFPVLAHPERYVYMDMADYERLKEKNILFQLNIASLIGAYGEDAQKKAGILLKKGFYNLCATDTHSLRFAQYLVNAKLSKKTIEAVRSLVEQKPF